jgi:4-hydroxy-tetrahydrodipicolinate synthase
MTELTGIVPSLNTPFDSEGVLDCASLARLIEHTVSTGCGGMLGLAVAGEQGVLTQAEKARFVDVVTEVNAGRIPFIVSVTHPEPSVSLGLAEMAGQKEAAGLCVQLPDHFDRNQARDFLKRLSDHTPLLMVQDLDWIGDGLALEDILWLWEAVPAFSWLKVETQNAGPKYSAVLDATSGGLRVCGGWAVVELMDALRRGVNAFIPTGMEQVYVTILSLYASGKIEAAKALFDRVSPVLQFSNQHIDVSIHFFKQLRAAEGLFATSTCRVPEPLLSEAFQSDGAQALNLALSLVLEMQSAPN